jgi:tetratricopeptide (TPR) repeat protein
MTVKEMLEKCEKQDVILFEHLFGLVKLKRRQRLKYLKYQMGSYAVLISKLKGNIRFNLELLGSIYMKLGNYEKAMDNYRKALVFPKCNVSFLLIEKYLEACRKLNK